jgi:hypothetical protein
MPATMARDAMTAAWASRFRPSVNSSGVADDEAPARDRLARHLLVDDKADDSDNDEDFEPGHGTHAP